MVSNRRGRGMTGQVIRERSGRETAAHVCAAWNIVPDPHDGNHMKAQMARTKYRAGIFRTSHVAAVRSAAFFSLRHPRGAAHHR
jgi:hypothetical protein